MGSGRLESCVLCATLVERPEPLLKGESIMNAVAKRLFREEVGEDLIEYALLVAFMAAVAMAVIIGDPLSLQTAVTNAFQDCADALNAL